MDTNEKSINITEMTDAEVFREFILENAGEFVTILLNTSYSANEQFDRLKDLYSRGGWHLDIKGSGGLFKHIESFDDPELLLLAIRRSAVPLDIKNVRNTCLCRVLYKWGKVKKTVDALRVSSSQNYRIK
jgi:hypothetical protein